VSTAHTDPARLRLLSESLTLWADLERRSEQHLFQIVGGVRHGSDLELDELHRVMPRFGLAAELLEPGAAAERWPGFRPDGRVLHTPQSARLDEGAGLQALRTAAVAHGAEFRFGERVTRLRVVGDDRALVEVVSQDAAGEPFGEPREFECRRLVVTLGAWTAKLLGSLLVLPRLQVTQAQTVYFGTDPDSRGTTREPAPPLPVIMHRRPRDDPRYGYWRSPWFLGVPTRDGIEAQWLGGRSGSAPLTDPDARSVRPDRLTPSALRTSAREWLPELDPDVEVNGIRHSLHTVARDGQLVIDRVGPVAVAVGLSGHGLTFTPAIGLLLAELTEGIRAPAAFSLRPERRHAPIEHEHEHGHGHGHGHEHGHRHSREKQTVNKAQPL
jgi:sarcosine oxidase